MNIPVYKKEDILKAIEDEGLCDDAWGYKTDNCIWVYAEGMEKAEVWEKYPTPLMGIEKSIWNSQVLDVVAYFLLEGYPTESCSIETLGESIDWAKKYIISNTD